MILVKVAGWFPEPHGQLEHSVWNGSTFTDLVFPFFPWIAGVAMTLSFAKRVERGHNFADSVAVPLAAELLQLPTVR